VTSWGEDARGELYITDRGGGTGTGEVFKIIPALHNLEVSGTNATPLLPGTTGLAPTASVQASDWTWEDLALSSSEPIDFYRVYRHDGNGNGTFQCVFRTPAVTPPARPPAVWPGGDPAVP